MRAPPLLFAIAVATLCRTVAAAPALDWDAPSECPSASWVSAEADRLGSRGETPAIASVHATITRGGPSRFHLRFETGDARIRELDADDCASLAETTALLLSVAEPAIQTPSPPLPLTIAPAPTAETVYEHRTVRPPPRLGPYAALLWTNEADGFAGVPALSSAGLAFGWRSRHLRGEAWAQTSLAGVSAPHGFRSTGAGVRVCPAFDVGDVSLGACVGSDAGRASASGVDGVYVRVLAGPMVDWSWTPRLSLRLQADAAYALSSPAFSGEGNPMTSGHVAGIGALALEVHF